MTFLIIFAVFGLMAIPCMLLFIIGGTTVKNKIGGCIAVLVFWLMFSGGFYFQEKANNEKWNGGHCSCGTHWELSGVTRTRIGTETKYYSCPNCHIEIEIIY